MHDLIDNDYIAVKTVENFVARTIRLYEQEPGQPSGSPRLGEYVKRWSRWIRAGLPDGSIKVLSHLCRARFEDLPAVLIVVITRGIEPGIADANHQYTLERQGRNKAA